MLRFFLLGLLAAFCFASDAALADKRVALVIGNGAYQNAPPLANPPRDANALADALRTKAGFDVVQLRTDLKFQDFLSSIKAFQKVADDSDIAVVFYAGHAIQHRDRNYLIPVNAVLDDEDDAKYWDEAIPLDLIFQAVAGAKRLRVLIFDACRENPFRQSRTPLQPGLGKVDENALVADIMIAYAANVGTVCRDADGEHSPFTEALLKHIAEPGLDIRHMLDKVRDDVRQSTKGAQVPFFYGILGGEEISISPARPEARDKANVRNCSLQPSPQTQVECLQDLIIDMQADIAALKADREHFREIIDQRIEEALEPRLHQ